MNINDISVATFNARQHRVSVGHLSLKNDSEWPAGNVLPYMGANRYGFKDISVDLIVRGEDREDIHLNCSAIIAALQNPAELQLDGYGHRFFAILQDAREEETVLNRWHTLKLSFEGYEYKAVSVTSSSPSISFDNPGNAVSPCDLIINNAFASVGSSTLTINGLCRDSFTGAALPLTVSNVPRGCQIVRIEGTKGRITTTPSGAPVTIDMWAFPSLLPGENTISYAKSGGGSVALQIGCRALYV